MKKNPFFQYLSVIMGIIFLFFLVIPRIRAIASLDDALLFNVVVQDKDGNPIPSAFVHLYSHDTEEIVYSGQTGKQGKVSFSYIPKAYHSIVENRIHSYFDYLIYVQKTGYRPEPYTLTKIIGYGATNETEYQLIMHEDSSYLIPENPQTNIATMDVQKTNAPFSVLKGSEKESEVTRAVNMPSVGFCQHTIPLGLFHANANSSVQVVFNANDKIKVETACSLNGTFDVISGITRGFSSTTTFPKFSPTTARKQALATVGRFERYCTTDSFSGEIYWYHELDSIIGGTEIVSTTICHSCDDLWTNVSGDMNRLHIRVDDGGEYCLEHSQESDLKVAAGISLIGEGFSGEVGVTRQRGNSTEVTYSPDSGYDIMLYSDNMRWEEIHVTSKIN